MKVTLFYIKDDTKVRWYSFSRVHENFRFKTRSRNALLSTRHDNTMQYSSFAIYNNNFINPVAVEYMISRFHLISRSAF